MKSSLLLSAAFAGLVAAASTTANAQDISGKCYGIAKAGQNSCASASGSHSCKGLARTDNEPGDWVAPAPADCIKTGGSVTAPASTNK